MDYVFVPLAKTDNGLRLLYNIHRSIYHDNNETKINRFDMNLVYTLIVMMYVNPLYANHIRLMGVPNNIQYRCTIAYNDDLTECIYLMPNVNEDPNNTDKDLIEEMLYENIKAKIQEVIDHFEENPEGESEEKQEEENNFLIVSTPATPPSSPATRSVTPIAVVDFVEFIASE